MRTYLVPGLPLQPVTSGAPQLLNCPSSCQAVIRNRAVINHKSGGGSANHPDWERTSCFVHYSANSMWKLRDLIIMSAYINHVYSQLTDKVKQVH